MLDFSLDVSKEIFCIDLNKLLDDIKQNINPTFVALVYQ